MTDATSVAILGAALTIINALWVFFMRGVKGELRTFRAEIATQLTAITTKMDLHVLDRIKRIEDEMQTQRRRLHEELVPAWARVQADVMLLQERVNELRKENSHG